MNSGPYSFERNPGSTSAVRQLALPTLIAAGICTGVTVYLSKRTKPEPEKPSEWTISWVELSDYQKHEKKGLAGASTGASPADSRLPVSEAPKPKE